MHHKRKDLVDRYQRDNQEFNELAGAEGMFLDRLASELWEDERVLALLSFPSFFRASTGRSAWRSALLVVTTHRILQLAAKKRFMGMMMGAEEQAGSAEELEVTWMGYDEVAGVSGRRTLISLGAMRELYIDRKSGGFVKIKGLSRHKSEIAEQRIRDALLVHA